MKVRIASLFAAGVFACAAPAFAWGGKGHTVISNVGAKAIAAQHELPAFLSSVPAIFEITYLGPEEDRLKGSGSSWDADNDPGHFVDLQDDGTVAGVVHLDALPRSQEAYDEALRAAHTDPYRQGYLPYALLDGWEQLRQDFAYWRVDKGDARAVDEQLILRDLGVWSHFVGDASQPLHVSVHFNGWGDFPNPNGYTQSHHTHSYFESSFVDKYANESDIEKLVSPHAALSTSTTLLSQETVLREIERYLSATSRTVPQLYAIEKAGGFANGSPEAIAFVDQRLAAGAQELRDLTVWAWEDSLNASVGYPAKPVRDIISGIEAH
jgi:hypothetical protein